MNEAATLSDTGDTTATAARFTPVSAEALPEFEPARLPRDHPAWMRDTLAISGTARDLIATLRPIVVRALTFWDHRLREVLCSGSGRLRIDASGCYRCD